MSQNATLRARIDEDTKARGNAVLDAIGLSVSDAVRLLYHRLIADQAFPLELKAPNAETGAAMEDGRAIVRARHVSVRKRKIDTAALRSLAERLPCQEMPAADMVRALRDAERY